MKRILTLLTITGALAIGATASEKHSIQSLTDDGSIIVLDDDSAWEVDGGDQGDTAAWVTGDDVILVNDHLMINVDESGEKAEVTRLR
jgi:hypothetical protein